MRAPSLLPVPAFWCSSAASSAEPPREFSSLGNFSAEIKSRKSRRRASVKQRNSSRGRGGVSERCPADDDGDGDGDDDDDDDDDACGDTNTTTNNNNNNTKKNLHSELTHCYAIFER